MPIRAILLLLTAISLGAGGQICLKIGVNAINQGGNASPLVILRGIFTPYVLAGFVLYGISSLLYLVALSRLDLSYAYPFVALSFVMVTLLSWYLLDETLPLLRVVGLVLILGGVLTVAASYRAEAVDVPTADQIVEQGP